MSLSTVQAVSGDTLYRLRQKYTDDNVTDTVLPRYFIITYILYLMVQTR